MEEYSNRRSNTDIGFPRRGSRISLRNQSLEERTNHNRVGPGSSTRLNPMRTRMADNQGRPRYLFDSFKSSSTKSVPASTSKFPLRKFGEEKQLAAVEIAENSRRKAEVKPLEGSKQIVVGRESSGTPQTQAECPTSGQGQLLPHGPEGSHFTCSSGIAVHRVGSLVRGASVSSRTHRQNKKEVYVHTSGCPSDYVHNRRFEAMRKRANDGESSPRSGNLSGPTSLGHSSPTYLRHTGPRIRTTEQPLSQQIIRRSSRNHQDSAVSVRTRRSSPQGTRLSVSEEREDHMLSMNDSSARNQPSDLSPFSFDEVSSEGSLPFSVELPHEIYSSNHRNTNTRTARRRSTLLEESPPQMFPGPFGERDSHRHITMNRMAEVLAALERIEQAEVTYELETNLFLGAFVSHDQHREMRMDIDSMSYEELLALEERIGYVSTALSEEQLARCLRRSIFTPVATELKISVADDIKCSICQEEYLEGEEVGRLPCQHQYHVCCIHQWLRQKNWCPVCKASALPSTS